MNLELEHGETSNINNNVSQIRSRFNQLSFNGKIAFFIAFFREFNSDLKKYTPPKGK